MAGASFARPGGHTVDTLRKAGPSGRWGLGVVALMLLLGGGAGRAAAAIAADPLADSKLPRLAQEAQAGQPHKR